MTIIEQLEKNKIVVAGGIVLLIMIGFVFWNFYLSPQNEIKEEQKKELMSGQFEKININFDVLEGEELEELEQIGTIPEYQGQIGRNNPFIQ